jgi:pimeloyl-ACP methyl ester carboxylesterase
MAEKNIILNNLLVHYREWNNTGKSGGALVFLHGWRLDGTIWFPIITALLEKTRYNIYALDLPGFGKSQTPPSDFSLDGYREIIKTFAEKLELYNIVIVGHSFGGRIAIMCAAMYPDIFQKIVLVDSAGIPDKTRKIRLKKRLVKIIKPIFRLPLISQLRPFFSHLVGSDDYRKAPEELRSVFLQVVNEDLTPLLPKIRAKTLLVWGAQDDITPLSSAELMKQLIPDSRLVLIENAGHNSFLDQKEKFLEILIKFLQT